MKDLISPDTYRILVEESLVGVYLVQNDRFIYANRKLAELFGYSREELLRVPSVLDLIAPSHREAVRESIRQRLAGEIAEIEYTVHGLRKDGQVVHLDVRSVRIEHEGEAAVLGTMVDITGRKQLEDELRTLALVDELTGLYNRRGFITFAERQLSVARRKQQPLLLIAADIDGLKGINDRFGHAVGDEVIMAAASVLRQSYREADIIARLGGDEFTVLLLDASALSTPLLLERLDINLRNWNERHHREFSLSMSTGTARVEGELTKDVQQLLSQADSQLYQQKRERGRLERPQTVNVPFWGDRDV